MEERIVQFRMGVMVVATLLITGILVTLFGKIPWLKRPSYQVHIRFPEARGVAKDTPVRKSGILIGRVSDVEFDPAEGVMVTAELHEDVVLRGNETARISGSLLGDAELQFVADGGRADQKPQIIQNGDVLQGQVTGNPLQAFNNIEPQMNRVFTSLTVASDEVNRLAKTLNRLLENNDEQINRIVQKTERALDSFQSVAKNVDSVAKNFDDVIGDEKTRRELKQSIADLPKVLHDANEALASIQQSMQSADRNLKNMEGFTRPLGERGDAMITKVDSSVTRLDQLLEQMVAFSKLLNRREGTFGKLLYSSETYDQVTETTKNVNALLRELQPVIADFKVFSDKLARHPSVILQGALKKDSGLK